MMTDPIADMLARIRNANTAHLDRTEMPLSKVKEGIAKILRDEGYIADFRVDKSHPPKLTVFLKYGRDRQGAISGIQRKSRPGRRYYVGYADIPEVRNGLGMSIVSTSKGLMSDAQARKQQVGGEIICEVW